MTENKIALRTIDDARSLPPGILICKNEGVIQGITIKYGGKLDFLAVVKIMVGKRDENGDYYCFKDLAEAVYTAITKFGHYDPVRKNIPFGEYVYGNEAQPFVLYPLGYKPGERNRTQ